MATVTFVDVDKIGTGDNGWYAMSEYHLIIHDCKFPKSVSKTTVRVWMVNHLNGEIFMSSVWCSDINDYKMGFYFSDKASATAFSLKWGNQD